VKVSFVIPLFNCLELTKACLASLHATLPRGLDHEIILVDDGSTDGTREWLRTLAPRVRVLLNERNLGYAASNNRGAREATGDILGLLNNDLVLLSGWLPPILRLFRFGRRPGLVGNIQLDASTGAIDHSGVFIQINGKPAHRGIPEGIARFRRVQPVIAVTGACAFVRRDTFLQLGGFDEHFVNGGEDVDFCLRAREAGLRNWVALGSRVFHHISASPGRKEHDERNSRRLAARWRDVLVREGARTWCRHFIEHNWGAPRELDQRLALGALLAAWNLAPTPPREAMWLVDQRMRAEELRWETMLGPAGT
jgi:GT2 family glycosyltransferase